MSDNKPPTSPQQPQSDEQRTLGVAVDGAALTDTLAPSGAIAPGRHRIHPAFIVLSSLEVGVGIFFALVVTMISILPRITEEASEFPVPPIVLFIGVLVVALLFLAVGFYIYYKRFSWEITETELHIYSGIFIKKQIHIPFQRVQSVDYTAKILERLLGLAKLQIETAGGANNKGVTIPALKLSEAEALRSEVFRRKKALLTGTPLQEAGADGVTAASEGPGVATMVTEPSTEGTFIQVADTAAGLRGILAGDFDDDAPVEYEYGLSMKELFLAAVSNSSVALMLVAVVAFLSQIPGFLQDWSIVSEFGADAVDSIMSLGTFLVTVLVVIILLVIWIISILSTMVSYGAFKARRRGGRIEVERGLLQRRFKGISITRVQSVVISQGFLRKLIGFAELKLLTIDSLNVTASNSGEGGASSGSTGLVIHPFVKMERIDDIIAHMVPEFTERADDGALKKLPPVAFRRSLFRWIVWPTLLCVVIILAINGLLLPLLQRETGLVFTPLYSIVVALVIIAFCSLSGIWWYKRAAYAYSGTMLTIRKGVFGQTTTIIPRQKIQWAATNENPLQRWRGVATISATTAAGIGGTKTSLRDLNTEEADAYIEWVRPHARG